MQICSIHNTFTTIRNSLLTTQRPAHNAQRGLFNEKSLDPFRPVRPAGLDFQARPAGGPARCHLYIEVYLCKGTRQILIGRLNRYFRNLKVIKQVGSGRLAGSRVWHIPNVQKVGQVPVNKTRSNAIVNFKTLLITRATKKVGFLKLF